MTGPREVAGPGPTPGQAVDGGYRALREGLGAYRPGRQVLWLHGPDAADYLQGQCSQDVAALAAGAAADSLLLAPDGKLVALVRLVRLTAVGFLIDVDDGFADPVVARLLRFRLRSKVDVDPLDWACLALRGPQVGVPGAAAAAEEGPVPPGPLAVDWNGWSGVDLLGPAPGPDPPPGALWCSEAAWEACRIESGVPVMGRELDERTIAAEAGLVERSVSFTKGCFTGQELVARLDARGNRVARRLCGLVVGGLPAVGEDGAAAMVGATLRPPGGDEGGPERGRVTSAAWSPALGAPVGLAYAHRSLEVPGRVDLYPADGGGPRAAELRPLPLV